MFKALKGSCPICNGDRKDCRTGDAGMIHCRSNSYPIGYEVHGEDTSGFTVYKPSRVPEKPNSELLSIIARNTEWRKSIGSLRSHHRKALLDRGLTSEMIDQLVKTGVIRSWEPGSQTQLDRKLPGIDPKTGKTLGVKGIAIAAMLDDKITGYQIANDDRSSAKYIWMSSANQEGSGPHLPNGDLPIACWVHPTETPTEAIVCEGFLKSLIVAQRLWDLGQTQYLVLGAAGGNFSASSNTTQQILSQHKITSVLLAPDAGAVANPQVMQAYDRTRTSVCVGLQFSVLWWGQETKDFKDIDELENRDLKNLALIDWDEFKSLVPVSAKDQAKLERKISNIELLSELVERCEIWQTEDRVGMIDIHIRGHRESIALSDPGFRSWMAAEFYERTGRHCSSDALSQILERLRGQARSAPTHEVWHRVAKIGNEIYVDLGDKDYTVIKICGAGWTIHEGKCPAKFTRPNSMKALPLPRKDADWSGLKNILNLQDSDWVLLMSWLSWGLHPKDPHPVLIFNGEQGTAKSKTTELIKRLLDPSKALLLSMPDDAAGLSGHASNRWVLAYDNLSGISTKMSDLLCCVATESGFAKRMLYTDNGESVFAGVRPIVLNGIEALAVRPDLLDRSIIINLQPISDEQRMTNAEWEKLLGDCEAQVFGAMLNALAQGLRRKEKVRPIALGRMADFHVWGHCVECAFGFEPGDFERAYQANRNLLTEVAIDNNATATAILQLLETQNFTGSVSDLLTKLGTIVSEEQRKAKDWIKSPRVLGRQLVRLAPELRKRGVEIETGLRVGNVRTIRITKKEQPPIPVIEFDDEEPTEYYYEYKEPIEPIEVGDEVVFADSGDEERPPDSYKVVEFDRTSGSCTIELSPGQHCVSRLEWLRRRSA